MSCAYKPILFEQTKYLLGVGSVKYPWMFIIVVANINFLKLIEIERTDTWNTFSLFK